MLNSYAQTHIDDMHPDIEPNIIELMIMQYCSYIYILIPWALLSPMALRLPYSHRFCFTFWDVLMNKRKKDRIRAMEPSKLFIRENRWVYPITCFFVFTTSNRTVSGLRANDRIPFAIISLFLSDIVSFNLTIKVCFGISSVKLYVCIKLL